MDNRSTSIGAKKLVVEYSNNRGFIFLNIERGLHLDYATLEWLRSNIILVQDHAVLNTERFFILSEKFYLRTMWLNGFFCLGLFKKDKPPYYINMEELEKLKEFLIPSTSI